MTEKQNTFVSSGWNEMTGIPLLAFCLCQAELGSAGIAWYELNLFFFFFKSACVSSLYFDQSAEGS